MRRALRVVHAASVNAWWSAGLEAAHFEADFGELLGQVRRGRLSGPPARQLRGGADVNPPAAKRPRGHHDGARAEAALLEGFDAGHASVVEHEAGHGALDGRHVGVRLDQRTHRATVQTAIALRTRRPDGRSLAAIEHSKLDGCAIGSASHHPAERIDLAHHGALGDAADGGVARHLPDGLERARDQRHRAAEASGRHGRFRAGVTAADHDDVKRGFSAHAGHEMYGRPQWSGIVRATERIRFAASSRRTRACRSPSPTPSPTLFIRKRAFAQHALARADFDVPLHLTVDEFRVEGELVAIGPVYDAEALAAVIADLEGRGLVYFEDFFDLSGNWPEWLLLFAMAAREPFADSMAG